MAVMKRAIKETIIVEGKDDTTAIKRAIDGHTIETHGFGISAETWRLIEKAYHTTGIIIFTDPDHAGEQIRRRITSRFPDAGQAYLDRQDATAGENIGIENGQPEDILKALAQWKSPHKTPPGLFGREDMIAAGLWGDKNAAGKRSQVGKILGIGYGNCSAFLSKLNQFQITKEEFNEAIHRIDHP